MDEALKVRTPRMWVRPVVEADRDEFLRVIRVSRELHAPWMPLSNGPDEGVFDRGMERARAGTAVRLVGVLDDGRIGGFFNLNEIVRGPFQNAYAGWSVSAEVAGAGFATEGVAALLTYAFTPGGAGLHRVQANILPRNARSLRVAEKCGFRREGLALRYLEIAGVWEDHVLTAITREEWATLGVERGPAAPPDPRG